MASSSEIFSSVVAGKIQNLASTSSRKREKISDISGSSSSILDEVIRNNYLDSVPTRIEQGESSFLNSGVNRVTFKGLNTKGTDADSGYFNMDGKQAGLRALGIDTPETSFYSKESKGRKTQKEHYARLWNVPEDRITDDIIFSMGRRTEEAFDIVASKGQQGGDIVADAIYDPTSLKWSNDKRTKATVTNPFTGADIYGAMNTPEFNTRWFKDTPEQNEIRAKYEAEHGNDYSRFKMPNEGKVVGTTQHGRPAFYMDGEVVSEKSTTIEMDGKWLNIPTIWDGKQLSEEELKQKLINNEISPTSVHKSAKEANIAAKARSQQIDYGQNEKADFFEQDKARRNALYADAIGADSYWTVFEKSVSSGTDNLQATGYGFAALIADATGNTEFATEMLEHYLSNIDEAQQNGANLPPIEEIDWANPDAALRKLVALLGEAMPSIVEIGGVALAAYFTGGAAAVGYGALRKGSLHASKQFVDKQIGKKALQKIKNRSAAVGGYMAANVMETGGIYGDVAVAGHRDARAITMSLAGGSAAAALEMFYPLKVLKKMGLGNQGTKALYKSFRKNGAGQVFKVIGKEMAAGGLTEGTTEALQFVIEEATQDLIKNGHLPDMTSSQFLWGMANSFVAGLVPGAAISGSVSTASQLGKQINGNEKVVTEENNRILREAVEAGQATANMTEQELIANEKKLGAAITKIEESEGLNLGDLNVDGMNNLEKAFAYIESLEPTQNEDGTVDTPISTPETEAIKNELISAIQNFTTDEANTQLQKEQDLGGVKLDAEIQAIEEDIAKQKEELTPGGKPKTKKAVATLEAERIKRITKKEQEANNRLEATGGPAVTQRKAKRAETKTIKKAVEKQVKRLNAISRKLKETNISKGHRKRLEQERNNLGRHITFLQKSVALSKTTAGKVERAISSFDYQHITVSDVKKGKAKVLNIKIVKEVGKQLDKIDRLEKLEDEDVNKGIAFIERLSQNINDVQELLEEVTDKKERALLAKILQENSATLVKFSKLYSRLKETKKVKKAKTTKTIKATSIKLNAQIKKRKDSSVKKVKGKKAQDDKLKSLDILYSLDPHNEKELNEIDSKNFDKEELKLLALQKKLSKLRNTYTAAINNDSEIVRVSEEIESGDKSFFKGFTTYLKEAQDDVIEISDFKSFVEHINKKANAFTTALAKARNDEAIIISKDTTEIVKQTKDGKYPDNKYWWIREGVSENLVKFVNTEAEMGNIAFELVALITGESSLPEIIEANVELTALGKAAKVAKKLWAKANDSVNDAITTEGDTATEILLIPQLKAKVEYLQAELAYWAKAEELDKKGATKQVANFESQIKALKEDIKGINADPDKLIYPAGSSILPYERKMKKFIKGLRKDLQKLKPNTQKFRELRAKIHRHTAELKKFKAAIKTAENKRRHDNHVLIKWKDKFLKLFDTTFTSSDLFEAINFKRKSFYSQNDNAIINAESIKKITEDLGITDTIFVDYLVEYFGEFKKGLEKRLITKNSDTDIDLVKGAYIESNPINLLYIKDDNGNITLPDEVIFAMMVSTIKWTSMNIGNMKYRSPRDIGLLLQGDLKYKPVGKEYRIFGNMGIVFANAAADIGGETLNSLNIKASIESAEEINIHEILNKISPSYVKNSPLIKDADTLNALKVAVGEMSLKIAASIKTDGALTHTTEESDAGLLTIVHGSYPKKHFKETDAYKESGLKRVEINTVQLRDVSEKSGDIEIGKLLESFNDNTTAIKLLNGSEGTLADILAEPAKAVTHVKNSLSNLPKKVVAVIQQLNDVEWTHKADAMTYYSMLDDENMRELAGITSVEDAHITEVDSVIAANTEKESDIQHIRDYLNKGTKSFYYKWVAQKQHRLLIRSLTINGQRSKIHRALFKPAGHDSVISTKQQRLVHKLAVAQALGFKTDGNTLDATIEFFDFAVEASTDITAFINSGKKDKAKFNILLKEFLAKTNKDKKYEIGASMHILEGITSLAKYDPDNVFTTDIMLETDAITNGYAIGLLQRLGVSPAVVKNYVQQLKDSKLDLTDIEMQDYAEAYALTDTLERIGLFVKPQNKHNSGVTKGNVTGGKDIVSNYEEFILSGAYDTYQTLAVKVAELFAKDGGYVAGKAAKKEVNRGIKRLKIKSLNINKIHIQKMGSIFGEFFVDEMLTKFARDFAKNPVLISGYGASVNRVIEAISEEAPIIIHKEFAKFQVKYNKLVNATGSDRLSPTEYKKAINALKKEVKVYETDLRIFLGHYTKDGKGLSPALDLVKHLVNKDVSENLRNFSLSKSEITTVSRKVKAIYKSPVTAALDELLKPMAEARDAMVKAGEYEALGFIHMYDKVINQHKTDNGKAPNSAQRLKIAEDLAPRFMPIYFGPWTDPDAGIELIKRAVGRDDKRIVTKFKETKIVRYKKMGKRFRKLKYDPVKSISSPGKETIYKTPGNSTYTNMVQNMDFVNLASTIMKNSLILPIHDAQMSMVNDVVKNNGNYNNLFIKNTLVDNSFLDTSLKRLEDVKVELDKEGIFEDVELEYRKSSFEAKNIIKEIDALKKSKNKTTDIKKSIIKNKESLGKLGFNAITDSLNKEARSTEDMHTKMEKIFGTEGKRGSWIGQSSTMYIPESLFDADVEKSVKTEQDSTTSELSERQVELTKLQDRLNKGESVDIPANLQPIETTYAEDDSIILTALTELDEAKVATEDDIHRSIHKKVKQTLKEVMGNESLSSNLDKIFEMLGNNPDSPNFTGKDSEAHRTHLKRIIDEIIKNTGDKLGNTTVTLSNTDIKANGEANITQDHLTINGNEFTPRTYAEQGGQEVYVHEILHILTRDALLNDSVFINKVYKIRKRVRKVLQSRSKPYEVFLHKNKDGSIKYLTDREAEIEAAKEMYEYVFGDNVPAEGILDEFLAYSLTNKFLFKELLHMPSDELKLWSSNPSDTVIEKIVKLIFTVFEKISNKLNNKVLPTNVAMELYVMTKDLVTVNERQRGRVAKTVQRIEVGRHLDKGNESIRKFFGELTDKTIEIGSKKYFELVDKWTKDGKVNSFVSNLLYSSKILLLYASYNKFIDDHPRVKELLDSKFKYFNSRTRDNFSSITADFIGNIDNRFSKMLFKSQKEIDVNRNQDKDAVKESLLLQFKALDELTDFESTAITKGLIKPDVSVLIANYTFTISEAIELVGDDAKLQIQIEAYYKKLKLDKHKDYATQADELATFMIKGKVHNYQQYKNAHAIHALSDNKIKGKNIVRDLEIYTTLLAIQKTEKAIKDAVKEVSAREFKLDKNHNGITHVLHFHHAIKEEVLQDGFYGNPMLVSKGYIADITDEDTQLEFAPIDKETIKAMDRNEFKLVKRLGNISGVTNINMGLYVSKNNPKSKRVKGIASLSSMQHAGFTIKDIWANNPDTAKGINERFEAFKTLQESKKNTLDTKNFTMLPILDQWGTTVNYSVHMHHALKEELLGQNLNFADVMSTTISRHRDKVASKAINRDVVALLHEYKKENYNKNPSKFVDILSPAYIEEYYVPLPESMKYEIMQRTKAGKSQSFYIERKYLDYVFGYILPSISELAVFKFHPKLQRYARVAEKFWMEMVALAKLNIVIKIPIVPTVNFLSNFFTSLTAGVPVKYIIKNWKEGIIELRRYSEEAKKLKLLDLQIAGNPSLKNDKTIIKKREILVHRVNSNPVAPFVEKGLFNSITEDINQNDFTYRHKIGKRIGATKVGSQIQKYTKGNLFKIANQAYMGESTATFKAAMHFTQMSDFIARYTLYKYQTEVKNVSKDKAWKEMVDTFVSYDQPLNRHLQWGNDMGVLFFIKYAIRIQRAAIALVKNKPLNVGLLLTTNQLIGLDVETIFESSILTGGFDPDIHGISKTFFEVVVPPGVEILSGEGL